MYASETLSSVFFVWRNCSKFIWNRVQALVVLTMGTKDGVQAGTIRARNSSLSQFIQFARRNQIFIGMTRLSLHHLDDAISDLNKLFQPFIKQRKVDVRREKARNLLHPKHFISYGNSLSNLSSLVT